MRAQGKSFTVTLDRKGLDTHARTTHPAKYGLYDQIETGGAILQFNRNREIVRARGKGRDWPKELEWVKRGAGDEWVFYAAGGYGGTFETVAVGGLASPLMFRVPFPYAELLEAYGEYYVPLPETPSNALSHRRPFEEPAVARLVATWHETVAEVCERGRDLPAPFRSFLEGALANSPERLRTRAAALFAVLGRRPTGIPPDARHVDYDVIPLNISDGCLHKCRFCRLKNEVPFAPRTRREIEDQIEAVAALYGRDLINYNALFLGEHDALSVDADTILWAAETAFCALNLGKGYMKGRNLFLFGSPDALLRTEDRLFDALEAMGGRTFINIGFESADPETLDRLGKPVSAHRVRAAFERAQAINVQFRRIEITANFLLGETLPAGHEPALLELCEANGPHLLEKGTLYLSPLFDETPSHSLMRHFRRLKAQIPFPMFLYGIQRL